MNGLYEFCRYSRQVALGAALLLGLVVVAPCVATATEPDDPIQIITPEDLAIRGKFVSDTLEIRIIDGAVSNLRVRIMLYQNGKLLAEEPVKLEFTMVEQDIDESANCSAIFSSGHYTTCGGQGGQKGAKRPTLLIAKQPATPEKIWREMKPGVYAHLIRIEGKLTDGDGSILVEEWVRWRTDGRQIEYLDIERYSELVDKAEIVTDAEGKPITAFVGTDRKLFEVGIDRKLEKEEDPQKVDLNTRIDDGVVLEQPEVLRKFELRNQLDDRNED